MSDIEEKQNYLRENIVDKEYDPDKFVDFLVAKLGTNDVNIELIEFEQLKKFVKEFIEIIDPHLIINPNPNPNPNPKLPELNPLAKCKDLSLQISDPKKVDCFMKSYVTYLVTTLPFKFNVRKRYSDFEWLRSMMQTLYLGSIIPPMPKKNYADQFKDSFILKRMRSLEKFMQTLILDPLLINSPIVYDFLTIQNEDNFNVKRIAYDKQNSPLTLNQIKNITGEINTSISQDQEAIYYNIKDNVNINEGLLKKISLAYKTLCDQMTALSQHMKDISDLWSELHKTSEQYGDNKNIIGSYKALSKLMNDWSESQKKQSTLLSLEIRDYFKFIKNEFRSTKVLIAKVDENRVMYYNNDRELLQRKEALYKRGNVNEWELEQKDMENKQELIMNKELAFSKMIPKKTKVMTDMKTAYGYYLNQIINEYSRIRDMNGIRHKERVISYSKGQAGIMSEMHLVLADLILSLS